CHGRPIGEPEPTSCTVVASGFPPPLGGDPTWESTAQRLSSPRLRRKVTALHQPRDCPRKWQEEMFGSKRNPSIHPFWKHFRILFQYFQDFRTCCAQVVPAASFEAAP